MSRAFVKEPEAKEPRCPPTVGGCGGVGSPVTVATVRANVGNAELPEFHGDVFYCSNPGCAIAYFDGFGTRVERTELLRKAWPKDPDGVACSCFLVAVETIEEYALNGNKAAMRELLNRAASGEARCATRAPDGRSCATEVRRIFMRTLGLEPPGSA